MSHPLVGREILFTRQRHEAKKAGLHWDYRLVFGDRAYSWATKKEMPEPGKATILFEQPVHDRHYALSKRVEIPEGEYGHGITTLDYVRKAKVADETEEDKLVINAGKDRFLLKKLDPVKYGEKAWLFKNLTGMGVDKKMEKKAEEKKKSHWNSPLNVAAGVVGGYVSAEPMRLGAAILGEDVRDSIHESAPDIADRHTIKKFLRDNKMKVHFTKEEGSPGYLHKDIHNSYASIANKIVPNSVPTTEHLHTIRGVRLKSVNHAVTMHELGHAKDFTNKYVRQIAKAQAPLRLGKNVATIGMLSNEKTRDYAPLVPLANAAITLREEGAANYHAYKGIKAHKGTQAANKFLTKLVPKQMGHYALATLTPVASTYIASKIIKNLRKNDE